MTMDRDLDQGSVAGLQRVSRYRPVFCKSHGESRRLSQRPLRVPVAFERKSSMKALRFVVSFSLLLLAAPVFAHEPANFDLGLIDAMTRHHQDGIKMAQMAIDKASHPELRALMEKTKDDQQKDIDKLQGWRDAWFPGAPKTGMHAIESMPGMMPESKMQMMMDKLGSATGNDFDVMFTETMAMHHDGAIKMSRDALKRATHAELKQFAQEVIDKQTDENSKLHSWHHEWEAGSGGHHRMLKE